MLTHERRANLALLVLGFVTAGMAACGSNDASTSAGDGNGGGEVASDGGTSTDDRPDGDGTGLAKDAGRRDAGSGVSDAGAVDASSVTDASGISDASGVADASGISDASGVADAHGVTDAGSGTGDASSGDAGGFVDDTCDPLVLEASVPAAGSLAAQDARAIVFLTNGTQWTLVSGGASATQSSAKPAGIAQMIVKRTEVSPDGRILVHFTAGATAYATFLDGSGSGASANAYSTPIELPSNTAEVHADATGRLYALDTAQVLWVESASGFDNTGALPIPAYSTDFAFTVDASGAVHLARVTTSAKIHLEMLRRPVGGAWSSPVDVHVEDYGFPLHEPKLAAGRDGSVHLAWWRGNPHGSPRDELYSRSMGGASWTVPERLSSGARLLDFEARGYDSAQALLETNEYIAGYGNQWARRCAPPNAYGWPSTKLTTDPASAAPGVLRASPSGRPAFMLSEKSVGRIVVRAK
ncbi:MAG: hypothetical protein U0235_02075 [Polyangiaceae bacterium]